MVKVCALSEKKCVPCQGGVPPLAHKEIEALLQQLGNKWSVNQAGHLNKVYVFDDFMSAMRFANQIADVAEEEAHHPDLIVAWGKCEVEIWTHKINGLTESDFILAAKIDQIVSN